MRNPLQCNKPGRAGSALEPAAANPKGTPTTGAQGSPAATGHTSKGIEEHKTHGATKAPAFQFYPLDYTSDLNVRMMTYEQRGIYWELVCLCWAGDGLPADVEDLAALTNLELTRFTQHWDKRIAQCFIPHPTKARFLYHKRLEFERAKQKVASDKARKSADTRWGKERAARDAANKEIAAAMRTQSSGNTTLEAEGCDRNATVSAKLEPSSALQLQSSTTNRSTASAAKAAGRVKAKKGGYAARAAEIWEAKTGGALGHGRAGNALKPLVEKHGEVAVLAAFEGSYFDSCPQDYWSVTNFATNYGRYAGTLARKNKPDKRAQALWDTIASTLVGGSVDV